MANSSTTTIVADLMPPNFSHSVPLVLSASTAILPTTRSRVWPAIALAFSTLTSGIDPWLDSRRRQAPTTVMKLFDAVVRRRIALLEASRLANAIMEQAETRRATMIEMEAMTTFDLET